MMKFSLVLVSSLTAAIGSAEANPFGIKPPTRIATPSKQISASLALRGGDLGPLTADTAAKALVVSCISLILLHTHTPPWHSYFIVAACVVMIALTLDAL